jgi:hypothetical protein
LSSNASCYQLQYLQKYESQCAGATGHIRQKRATAFFVTVRFYAKDHTPHCADDVNIEEDWCERGRGVDIREASTLTFIKVTLVLRRPLRIIPVVSHSPFLALGKHIRAVLVNNHPIFPCVTPVSLPHGQGFERSKVARLLRLVACNEDSITNTVMDSFHL